MSPFWCERAAGWTGPRPSPRLAGWKEWGRGGNPTSFSAENTKHQLLITLFLTAEMHSYVKRRHLSGIFYLPGRILVISVVGDRMGMGGGAPRGAPWIGGNVLARCGRGRGSCSRGAGGPPWAEGPPWGAAPPWGEVDDTPRGPRRAFGSGEEPRLDPELTSRWDDEDTVGMRSPAPGPWKHRNHVKYYTVNSKMVTKRRVKWSLSNLQCVKKIPTFESS